jgi:hypothetical protein
MGLVWKVVDGAFLFDLDPRIVSCLELGGLLGRPSLPPRANLPVGGDEPEAEMPRWAPSDQVVMNAIAMRPM